MARIRKSKDCKYVCLSCHTPVNSYATMLCRGCARIKHELQTTKPEGWRAKLKKMNLLPRRPVKKEEVHNTIQTEVYIYGIKK